MPEYLTAAAAAAGNGTILNSAGINALLATVFGFVVLTLGIRAGMHAHRSNFAAVIGMVGVVAIAAMIWNIAIVPGQITTLGSDLTHQLLSL